MAVAAKKAAAPASSGVNFGELGMYSGGSVFIPEDNYCLSNPRVEMFKGEKSQRDAKLAVLIDLVKLDNPAESILGVWSMGSKAHLSFQPDPSGHGLVAVPGGPAANLNDQTNWSLLLKSLYDSGLPQGIFSNDLSVLDGMWAHIANVPEPQSRKLIQSRASTGEAAADAQPQGSGTVAVVTEIMDDGKPWENTGGIPEVAPKGAKPAATKVVTGKPATVQTQTAPAPPSEPDEDVDTAAMNAIAAVLGDKPNGCPKLILQTSVFKALNGKNPEMAQAVASTYFKAGDDTLNTFLEGLGYKLAGSNVVPS